MASTQLTRQLGKDGPQVTALGFGAMGLSAFYGPTAPDEERLEFLDHVYAQGEKFWDSSDIYGDSEELIGKSVPSGYHEGFEALVSSIYFLGHADVNSMEKMVPQIRQER